MSVQTIKNATSVSPGEERLLSLDFFRGFTMFLLVGEGTAIFSHLADPALQGTILGAIGQQFQHHEWHGLHFWDLIQPFFMFIVGVAIPFSVAKRTQRGDNRSRLLAHAIQRSLLLLLLGWGLYCIEPGRITFRFQNVLAQLSVTYLIAFLMLRRSFTSQAVLSFALILLTELLYRFFPAAGYNQPFTPDHNFGAYIDMIISGELSGGHWVSFNAIPTTAHTMWGVMAGQWLMRSDKTPNQKTTMLFILGLVGVVVGYSLDPFSPIIKRICTSSFVIVSGGWCLVVLAFSYWLIDVQKIQSWSKFFAIVGMNPLFIYLFAEIGGGEFLSKIPKPFTAALFSWAGEVPAEIINSAVTWGILWYMCYWLYKRKIFIRL